MSTQFEKGDKVLCIRSTGSIGEPVKGMEYVIDDPKPFGHVDDVRVEGIRASWQGWRFEKVEPEDKADLYVEPEPLKAGDWVQVWAQVDQDLLDGDVRVRVPIASRRGHVGVLTSSDAIIRTDDTPPWVEYAGEPDGRFAMVMAGAFTHSRSNVGGPWLGSDGTWRDWDKVRAMATDGRPRMLLTDVGLPDVAGGAS